ncbi:MAG: carboxymuconolactone decarboxylase family protein [Polyangiaceae bacterium]
MSGSGLFVRLSYWMARKRLGRVPAPVGVMAHNRWVLAAVAGYELAQEKAHALDSRLKGLANLKVATEVGCRFCIDIGSAVARRSLSEDELRDLPEYRDSPRFSSLEKRVLDYAVAMSRAPMVVPPELSAELTSKLGVPALVELTAVIAWENYRSRFNHAVGAEEEGYAKEGAFCLLPPRPAGELAAPALATKEGAMT